MRLYEITEAYMALDNLDDTEDIKVYLGAIQDEFNDKLESTTYVIQNYKSEIEAIQTEIKRLSNKKKSLENKVIFMTDYMYENMKALDMKKAKAGTFDLKIQKNPKSVKILDEAKITDDYIRVKKELDKAKIKEALKNGLIVEGAELIQTEGLRIRWKILDF